MQGKGSVRVDDDLDIAVLEGCFQFATTSCWVHADDRAAFFPETSFAAQIMRKEGEGGGASPGCFAHPKSRAFWLGGGSEGRRAQGSVG